MKFVYKCFFQAILMYKTKIVIFTRLIHNCYSEIFSFIFLIKSHLIPLIFSFISPKCNRIQINNSRLNNKPNPLPKTNQLRSRKEKSLKAVKESWAKMNKKDSRSKSVWLLKRPRRKPKRKLNNNKSNRRRLKNKSSLTRHNISKTGQTWWTNWKSPLKPTHILTSSMSRFQFQSSYKSTKPLPKKANSSRKSLQLPAESLTSELKERILFSTISRVKVRDFKSCVTSTITKVFKALLMFTQSSEEVTLSVSLVNQEKLKEESFRSLQEKSSFYPHVFTCCPKPTSVSRTKNPDTERDIWTWSWTRNLDKPSLWDQRSSVTSDNIWTS